MSRSKLIPMFVAFSKEALRNKMELFFILFFPLIFLILFGTLFQGSDSFDRISVGLYQSSETKVKRTIEEIGAWRVSEYQSQAELVSAVQKSKVSLGISFDGKTLIYSYKEGDPKLQGLVSMAQMSISTAIEKQANEINPVFVIEHIPEIAGKVKASNIDYIMSGVIAISILSAGLFSVIGVFGRYRKSGVLKRFKTIPLKPLTFIFGCTLSRLLQSFLSVLFIMVVGKLLFGLSFQINWILFVVAVISSTLGMMAVGLILTLLFRNPETASSIANILIMTMYFLAGVLFPIAFLPGYLKALSAFLPVKYVVILLRHAMGIELIPLTNFALICAVLLVSGVVLLYITGRELLKTD